jgi:prepilin-type N-terminal cleavage/methylation domain-containing protein
MILPHRRLFNQSVNKGFTVIELLVIIVIILIISSIIYLIINPVESAKRGRDAIRMSDLSSVFRAITIAIDIAGEPSPQLLCFQTSAPCSGVSDQVGIDTAKSDGSGWVKIKLDTVAGAIFPKLPTDPLNKEGWKYEYKSSGYAFEVNTAFESQEYLQKMNDDGGNNVVKYELGSDLSLIN